MAQAQLAVLRTAEGTAAEPVVSVIMIFLDAAPFIAEAIDSVIGQTLGTWELILVDDGATDGSELIAASYARERPAQIQVCSHPGRENRGMSASRNAGLQAARGRYVAFLDADDVYLPHRLQRHVDILERFPDVDMVQSELVHWYSWEPPSARRDEDYVRPLLRPDDHVIEPPDGLLLAIAVPLYSVGICNITVRRQVLLELGGFESEFRAAFEDQVALVKIYLHCKVYVLQAFLARYRRHPGSWTRQAKEQGARAAAAVDARRAFHRWLIDHCERAGVADPLLAAQLQRLRDELATMTSVVAPRLPFASATAVKRSVLEMLPRTGQRQLLRWNRTREFRAARARYDELCTSLQRSGRADGGGVLGRCVLPRGDVEVSVIMIFLDAGRFITEAIDSVLQQTATDWELVLVDDGSTDGSSAIARRYAEQFPERIRYFQHSGGINRGTGPSRNLGLQKSRGRYAAFLDADDVYLPERLAAHAAALAAHPRARLIISKELYWYSWSNDASESASCPDEVVGPVAEYDVPVEPPTLLETALRRRGAAMPGTCSITFDRQLALDLGGVPERFTGQYEDQALIAKLMLAAIAIVLDAPLTRYRQHASSMTHRLARSGEYRPGRPHQAHFDYLRWLREYSAESAPQFIELDAVLHRRLWPTRHAVLSAAYESARSVYRSLMRWARR
jgi:glycosyltransferase involved in cell wall biosynthesis